MIPARPHPFPRLRWLGPIWLAVYLPSYAIAYGWANFLFLCNLGVMITAAALWFGSGRWLSAQAIAALPIGTVWALDFSVGLAIGQSPFGFTAYMWDPRYPLFTRALSLYHLAWPLLLLWLLARIGYDRRGWRLQSLIVALVLPLSRLLTDPGANVNFAFVAPLFDRQLGPPALHLAILVVATTVVLYGPVHWLLERSFGRESRAAGGSRAFEALDLELADPGATEGHP